MVKTFADVRYVAEKLDIDYMAAAHILEKVDSVEDALMYLNHKSRKFKTGEVVRIINFEKTIGFCKILNIGTKASVEFYINGSKTTRILPKHYILVEPDIFDSFNNNPLHTTLYTYLNKMVFILDSDIQLEKATKEEKIKFRKTKAKQRKEWIKKEFHR